MNIMNKPQGDCIIMQTGFPIYKAYEVGSLYFHLLKANLIEENHCTIN